ncbi:MAG: DUF58 domain-containing protein [Acidimicrobiia bacterium]|nr:DUF58 domain-containing protein [Acidimicrobiia bacterium]
MSPSPRVAILLAATAFLAFVSPLVAIWAALLVVAATLIDALLVARTPTVRRFVNPTQSRGVESYFRVEVGESRGSVVVRQPIPTGLAIEPSQADGTFEGTIRPIIRGRIILPPVAVRLSGPMGLGRWTRSTGGYLELRSYPDLPKARSIAARVKRGAFVPEGQRKSPLRGMGSDFDAVREYHPEDDIRLINWRASARLARPMVNQYRLENNHDLLVVVDAGRLMMAPLQGRTRLDASLDAVTALASSADALGDRIGAVAFDFAVRYRVPPRRDQGRMIVNALHALQGTMAESDYDVAFRAVDRRKRCMVVILTDFVDEQAAKSLLKAVPIYTRHHAVIVAACTDTDVKSAMATTPQAGMDVARMAIASTVQNDRLRVAKLLRRAGARVIEAPPERLPAALVRQFLDVRARQNG